MSEVLPCALRFRLSGACARCGLVRWLRGSPYPEPVPGASCLGYVYARCVDGTRLADKELDLSRWQRLGRAK